MALEGGVPAIYAEAFARMQAADPYSTAVDEAGRFLDMGIGSRASGLVSGRPVRLWREVGGALVLAAFRS